MLNLAPEYWSKTLQGVFFVENTALYLAGTRAQDALSANGRKFHIPIMSNITDGAYTPGVDIVDSPLTSTRQDLEVDTFRFGSAVIDDVHAKQSLYAAAARAGEDIQRTLNNRIEQAFLARVIDADHTIDAASVGTGAAGANIALSTANVVPVMTAAHTALDVVDVPMTNRVAVVGPGTIRTMRELKGSRETMLGDTVLANGVIGPWQGWTVVQNNNLPWSALLRIATLPIAGEAVSIAGVIFTFVTTLGTAPGNVLIGANPAASRANLRSAVMGLAGAGTTYIDVIPKRRYLLIKRAITCTSDENMAFAGFGDIAVRETLSAPADIWSAQRQDSWFGLRGATDLVVQLPVKVEETRIERQFATRIKALAGFGVRTFDDGAQGLVRVRLSAANFV
ncbi:MAG: hypothetical protein DDT31_01453 [Syntrophomonadaceae bacterium]|nr:hypothetical protein [Bacillota bacterium]